MRMERKYLELLTKGESMLGLSQTSEFFSKEDFDLQKLNTHMRTTLKNNSRAYGISLLKNVSSSLQALENDLPDDIGTLELGQSINR